MRRSISCAFSCSIWTPRFTPATGRLVNKGFTPRMIAQLEQKIHETADEIIDTVIEKGEADFVTDISAELPLIVIADLLGVPQSDRHAMFSWSNRMIGREDPEYGVTEEEAGDAAARALCLRGGPLQREATQPPRRPYERADSGGARRRTPRRDGAGTVFLAPDRRRQRDDTGT